MKRSTLQGILKRKRDYEDIPDTHTLRKRLCPSSLRSVDDLLMQRIEAYKAWRGNATIAGTIVTDIAKREGVQLSSDKDPSRGWLYRFQQRNGMWFSLRHDEGDSVDMEAVDEGPRDLQDVVAKYHPRDVYHMDETSFFYRRDPKGTLTVNRKENGKKQINERIAVCVATNADGTDRLQLHFIGKSQMARPLKGRNVFAELGVTYMNTTKTWVNTVKYCEGLEQPNKCMRGQQRHVLLLVDNVSSHNDDPVELSNVVVYNLPPNTTDILQPMDQGIVKAVKDYYCAKKQEAGLVFPRRCIHPL